MSESGHSTALVPASGTPFQMPNFQGRLEHMKAKYENSVKGKKLDVQKVNKEISKNLSKVIYKIRDNINDGHKVVKDNQKNLAKVILKIKAMNKKIELEKKIKHMGIHEAVLQKKEMEEKLKLLNENVELLAGNDSVIEADEEQEGEGDEPSSLLHKSSKNRQSVDAIHTLENKLGLPISDKHARVVTYKDKMHITKNEFLKSQQNAEHFVNKMKEKEQELKNKRRKRRDKEAYKTQTYMTKESETKKEYEEKRKKRVLERIEEHKELLRKEKERRAKREETWKEFKLKEKSSKPLYKEIEERYKKDVLMPELEKKKKKLEDIRKFHKPIQKEDLDEGEKDYQEKLKLEMEKQRIRREKWYSDIGYGVYDENKYKTKFYEQAMEDEKKKEDTRRVDSAIKREKAEKMNNYAKIVKEMHWPQVSPKKRQEIEELKYQMEHSNRPKFRSPANNPRYNSSESPEREKILKKPNWKKFHNPMVPKPETKREGYKVDWLAERRNKRENQDKESGRMHQSQTWKNIAEMSDIDDNTKAQLLKSKARLLEENAQRREQINKVQGSTMEGTAEVNEMLINAIESKLSLLDNYMQS